MVVQTLTLLLFLLFSQQEQVQFTKALEISGEFIQLSSDNMGGIYVINKKHNLLKLNGQGDTLYTYEDKSFPVYFCDPSNGLKILIFNEKQNTLNFLDKTLTPINQAILLDRFSIPITNAISSSRDNLFWVFDENNQTLRKYDHLSNEMANSGNLVAITGQSIQPIYLREQDAKVYAVDSVKGVFQFDHLGTFLFNFREVRAEKIAISGNKMVFLKSKELYIYDTFLMETKKLELEGHPKVLDFALDKTAIVILTEQSVQVFRSKAVVK